MFLKRRKFVFPISKKERQTTFKNKTYGFFIFVICLLYLTGFSFAKNIETIFLNAETTVAEPIFIVEGKEPIKISEQHQQSTYHFTIKNYQEDKISAIDLRYYIEITPLLKNGIKCKLYQNGKEISLEKQKTEYIEIPKEIKKEHEYQLIITYQQKIENLGQDIFEKVQLKVHSEQQKG